MSNDRKESRTKYGTAIDRVVTCLNRFESKVHIYFVF
jgi:hypothetical protein